MNRRPNLFIVGAPRCGTTSMYYYLREHPQIFMSPTKEPSFFNPDLLLQKEKRQSKSQYDQLFKEATNQPYVGEAHVWNLYSTCAAKNIKKHSPDAKIIAILRNPIDLICSIFRYNQSAFFEDQTTLEQALILEDTRRQGFQIPEACYLVDRLFYRSIPAYYDQLKRYFDEFGGDAIHVIVFEEFTADPQNCFHKLMNFLGTDRDFQPSFKVNNPAYGNRSKYIKRLLTSPNKTLQTAGQILVPNLRARNFLYKTIRKLNYQKLKPYRIATKTKQVLIEHFRNENVKLSELINKDLSHWLN